MYECLQNELITWKTVKYQMDDIASTKTSISITQNSKDTEKNAIEFNAFHLIMNHETTKVRMLTSKMP